MAKKTLGRGLQALLGGGEESVAVADRPPRRDDSRIAISEIDANPYQPRRDFDAEEIASLAQTIQAHGIIQPIAVRQAGDRYQLIAGERRLRAAQEAGLTEVPARVLEIDDQQSFEFALIENLQRRDLNAIEKAQAFQGYVGQFEVTHEELASQLGIDRSTVTNLIRLLELPDAVQEAVRANRLTNGHARALLSLEDPVQQIALCRKIVDEKLSVRQTEQLVKQQAGSGAPPAKAPKPTPQKSNHLQSLETDLRRLLGTKVDIQPKAKDKGVIAIHFESHDDFERVMEALGASRR